MSSSSSSRQQAVNMMSNTVSNALILSFMLFISANCVRSQTLEQEIAGLPACSTTCLAKAAVNVKCGAGDFVCQCQFQESIVGVLGRISSQATCLLGDCGLSNSTTTRVTFRKICSILSASSSSTTATAATIASTSVSTYSEQIITTSTSIIPSSTSSSTSSSSSSSSSTSSQIETTSSSSEVAVSNTRAILPTSLHLVTSLPQVMTALSQTIISTAIEEPTALLSLSSSISVPSPTSNPSTFSTTAKPTTQTTAIPISVTAALTSLTDALITPPSTQVSLSTSSFTSAIMGAAKMSPIAESNSYIPGQAEQTMPMRQTRANLSAGAIIGIIIGAVVIVVAILGGSFWYWRRKKMASFANHSINREETAGIGGGPGNVTYQQPEPEIMQEKSLPPNPVSPRTPAVEEPSFEERKSSLTLNIGYSPPEQRTPVMPTLQPTTYNPSQRSEPSKLLPVAKKPDQEQYRSTVSSFLPSNNAHKSVASSFFASIPILLDSKEGRCDECLHNQEKFRFARSSGVTPLVCACASKHPSSTIEQSRGVSGLSITRSEVEEELLVGRVPTLMPERRSIIEDDDWEDELALDRELSKISEVSDVKPLRSNPVVPSTRPLFGRKGSSKESFEFSFKSKR